MSPPANAPPGGWAEFVCGRFASNSLMDSWNEVCMLTLKSSIVDSIVDSRDSKVAAVDMDVADETPGVLFMSEVGIWRRLGECPSVDTESASCSLINTFILESANSCAVSGVDGSAAAARSITSNSSATAENL